MAHIAIASTCSMPMIDAGRMPMASNMPNSRVRSKTVIMSVLTMANATRMRSSQYINCALTQSIRMPCSISGISSFHLSVR